jgi:predicted CoA-binding protein
VSDVSGSVREFLDQRRIAVAGVSRESGQAANAVYTKLRDAGYEVFAINPKATEVEGVPCYPDLGSVPGGVDGVIAATPPRATEEIARQCSELGVRRLWMHRSFGEGSVSEEAVRYCREQGIDVIVGGCPLMFCEPVDIGHRCMRWMLRLRGRLPA